MSVIWITVAIVAGIGIIAAILLWAAAKKFHVEEDPRIAEVEALLPGANCGGCGKNGCHDFALACTTATTLEGLAPGVGNAVMEQIAGIVGLTPVATAPKVAIVRCGGACSLRPKLSVYDGVRSCAIEASIFAGAEGCAYGCLGCGDCVEACPYDAIHLNEETRLPEVDFEKCVGCGKCVSACPRSLTTLIEKHDTMVWVACMNRDKGPAAMKVCQVSCIGCGKCMKVCEPKAIKVSQFVASINQDSCIACGNCIEVCPRSSIHHKGFIPKVDAQTTNDENI